MTTLDYNNMSISDKANILWDTPKYAKPESVQFKINADYVKFYSQDECYRELMVSYFPMLPLLENTVTLEEADYILYMHLYARCEDMSEWVVQQLTKLASLRKEGAEIIVVGKAANAEKLLNGSIENITFWGDHFTEKLGQKFGIDIKEQYFVYDDIEEHLAIWPVDGCLQKCKFCRRSYMDIKFESLSLEIIEENLNAIKEKHPEHLTTISLRAENLTEYGIDVYGKPMLHKLIELIDSYDEVKNIEFPIGLSIGEITPEILDSLCNSKKITLLYANLEAGSDRLLKLIGKKHTREQAIYVFTKIRESHPDIEIHSTVMLGLPTETVSDILALAHLVGKAQPDRILANHYIMSPNHPLSKFPQITDSQREYHLKMFLKYLKHFAKRNLEVDHPAIFKKRNSKKTITLKENLKRQNETNSKKGILPLHYQTTTTYIVS